MPIFLISTINAYSLASLFVADDVDAACDNNNTVDAVISNVTATSGMFFL